MSLGALRLPSFIIPFAVVAAGAVANISQGDGGFLIRLADDRRIEVVPFHLPKSGTVDRERGIAVWSRGGSEQWAAVPGALPKNRPAAAEVSVGGPWSARGAASGSISGPEAMTFQPEQLLGQTVTRAAGLEFLTPVDQGFYLGAQPTFRRRPSEGKEKFPAAEVTLRRGAKDLLKLSFAAGQSAMAWDGIPKLPAELKAGLTAGAYTLRNGDGPITGFQIMDEKARAAVWGPLEPLRKSAGADSPEYLLAVCQHLSGQPDEEGELRSYYADVLDHIEDVRKTNPAPRLARLQAAVTAKLQGKSADTNDATAVGIEIIDAARSAIQMGQWDAATATLADEAASDNPRTAALAVLYRAVIAAESGAGSESADGLFEEALDKLKGGTAADLFRAHNNYGGMLFARARDQLHNHGFQAAGGVQTPLLRALADWTAAKSHYETALEHAATLDPALLAGVKVNLAHVYALLADLIRVLDTVDNDQRGFTDGESAAISTAAKLAEQAALQQDAPARAAALELAAQLAFRSNDDAECVRHATAALDAYFDAESLAGLESVHRLLGLNAARIADDKPAAASRRDEALRHLQISHQLTELLRERIPTDRTGRSRAGFFARRAYVNERMIELLLAKGNDREAFVTAECAKARSLQDLLAARGASVSAATTAPRNVAEILADWPANTVAVEYFLGVDRSWGFLINHRGEVKAWKLVDAAGRPVASRDLIRRVQALAANFEGQANKMFRRASAGQGFDHAWQHELHRFGVELLPPAVMQELRAAEHVVIVPHHVLHYFPFAAVVTELDPVERGKLELPQPKFLVEEKFSLSRAPSVATWDRLRQRSGDFSRVQAVGIVEFAQADPLPGVEQDLANLREVFGERLQPVVAASDASETRVKELLREPGMIFLGTHGRNIAASPLNSHLLCHADDVEDGLLTAGELFSGEVGASLVVMSACYSGLADQSPLPGDDLFGLERALLTSGAATVVSGLWDVYDETGPLLMKDFFRALVAGKPTAAALADAQRRFLSDRRKEGPGDPWMHPYFWSVYTISGNELTALERPAR